MIGKVGSMASASSKERTRRPLGSRVPVVLLQGSLAPGDLDVASVDDDDVLAGVDVLRVLRAVLAAQHARDVRRQATERLTAGVDQEPTLLELGRLGLIGQRAAHAAYSSISSSGSA